MKKKLILIAGVSVLGLTMLTGCERPDLYFEGKLMPVENVEEILEDRLENENGLDYEVTIVEETE